MIIYLYEGRETNRNSNSRMLNKFYLYDLNGFFMRFQTKIASYILKNILISGSKCDTSKTNMWVIIKLL